MKKPTYTELSWPQSAAIQDELDSILNERAQLLEILSKLPSDKSIADSLKERYGIDVNLTANELIPPLSARQEAIGELLYLYTKHGFSTELTGDQEKQIEALSKIARESFPSEKAIKTKGG